MSNLKFFLLLIYLLNLISIILCQLENKSMSKALACISIITEKFKGQEPDQSLYSTMMLKCFITLSESQAKKLLVGLETGTNILNKKEIDRLTDISTLKDLSQSELEKKSYELEKALKNFKKLQEQISGEVSEDFDPSDYDDDYDDDDNTETPSNINFFGLIPKGIYAVFKIFNNYLFLFIVFVIVYFSLLMIRKINDSERKMKKKKRMMKQRNEEEYEEEEEEDYEQEINDKNKKLQKKFKNN